MTGRVLSRKDDVQLLLLEMRTFWFRRTVLIRSSNKRLISEETRTNGAKSDRAERGILISGAQFNTQRDVSRERARLFARNNKSASTRPPEEVLSSTEANLEENQ